MTNIKYVPSDETKIKILQFFLHTSVPRILAEKRALKANSLVDQKK